MIEARYIVDDSETDVGKPCYNPSTNKSSGLSLHYFTSIGKDTIAYAQLLFQQCVKSLFSVARKLVELKLICAHLD